MTYTVTNVEEENSGSQTVVYATVDVTSLASLGTEPIDTDAAFGLEDASLVGVSIRGQENGGYQITWDHINDALAVKYADYDAASDGVLIDVPNNTDVGEVVLEVIGT